MRTTKCAAILESLLAWALVASPAQAASPKETVLHAFAGSKFGAVPQSALVSDPAGNFYGTTSQGGVHNRGVVFRLSPAGVMTVLHAFTGPDGAYPVAAVALDSAGDLYGATTSGGQTEQTSNGCFRSYPGDHTCGVIFKLTAGGSYTVLHAFAGGGDGGNPWGTPLVDSAGNLYVTTASGGQFGGGTVFKLSAAGNGTVFYSFGAAPGGADGTIPYAGLVMDTAGNLYGTAESGGANDSGVVFKLDPSGEETVLVSFANGAFPVSGVAIDPDGNLYGINGSGCDVIYEINPSGAQSVLYDFCAHSVYGLPVSGVTLDSAGDLYGAFGSGVYKLSPSGDFAFYSFSEQPRYLYPNGGLLLDAAGNIYGPGWGGGGGIFKIDTALNISALYQFPNGPDGENPYSGVTLDSRGNLYGTTSIGGVLGMGALFTVDAAGKEKVLLSFSEGATGCSSSPSTIVSPAPAGVTLDSLGNIYGTTVDCQTGTGILFKLDPSGNETVLHTFGSISNDGLWSFTSVTIDAAGNLYGTTCGGGEHSAGTIFKLSSDGQYSILYHFTGRWDACPLSPVIPDSDGNLFGTASGSSPTKEPGLVFRLDSAGKEKVLYRFPMRDIGTADGLVPMGQLVLDASGNLYGTTLGGGTHHGGIVYKIARPYGSKYRRLYSFRGHSGRAPVGGLTLGADGNLYGATVGGGLQNKKNEHDGYGVVFRLTPSGEETIVHTFDGTTGGSAPYGAVTFDGQGNLYGTTYDGGNNIAGVVFKVSGVIP